MKQCECGHMNDPSYACCAKCGKLLVYSGCNEATKQAVQINNLAGTLRYEGIDWTVECETQDGKEKMCCAGAMVERGDSHIGLKVKQVGEDQCEAEIVVTVRGLKSMEEGRYAVNSVLRSIGYYLKELTFPATVTLGELRHLRDEELIPEAEAQNPSLGLNDRDISDSEERDVELRVDVWGAVAQRG